jgi:SSS family solute:Na+ symporter
VALPPQASPDLVLPAVLQQLLPTWLGALALAAVFSTEVDTSDAILFMISTSMSKDIFKRYLKPERQRAPSCCAWRAIPRWSAARWACCSRSTLSAIVQAMTVFYSLLGVSLFVPVLAGCIRSGPVGRGARVDRRRRADAARGTLLGCRRYPGSTRR